MDLQNFIQFVVPFGLAMILTTVLLPLWISICRKWHLFDEPDSRKHHSQLVPSMGGIAIFAGMFIAFLVFANITEYMKFRYLLGGVMILFFTGFFDDLMNVPPGKKFFFQLIASCVVYFGGFRILSLLGFAGIGEIPMVFGFPLTLIVISMFTNAYNFIDGIDGLAASLGVLISASLGTLFIMTGRVDFATLSFCITGSLAGFLIFNFAPARIFMGDTGSLIIGFLLIVLGIEMYSVIITSPEYAINPAVIAAIFFAPAFDIARVIFIRLLNGKSPFHPDRNHIHHKLLTLGFGHGGSTLIICAFASSVILLQFLLYEHSVLTFLLIAVLYALLFTNIRTLTIIAGARDKVRELLSAAKA
jgi:UDP-N-acetylmuramyl pentapeptide phosphotransferase/UDP-N-acetylglucosamine-1-phosphate transferase